MLIYVLPISVAIPKTLVIGTFSNPSPRSSRAVVKRASAPVSAVARGFRRFSAFFCCVGGACGEGDLFVFIRGTGLQYLGMLGEVCGRGHIHAVAARGPRQWLRPREWLRPRLSPVA